VQTISLKEAWNDLTLMMKDKADSENNPYFDSKFVQGAITIAHYGCGIYAMLVITGEQKGKIWIDDRTNDGGIYPATQNFVIISMRTIQMTFNHVKRNRSL
jgi:hypothetical protein